MVLWVSVFSIFKSVNPFVPQYDLRLHVLRSLSLRTFKSFVKWKREKSIDFTLVFFSNLTKDLNWTYVRVEIFTSTITSYQDQL